MGEDGPLFVMLEISNVLVAGQEGGFGWATGVN